VKNSATSDSENPQVEIVDDILPIGEVTLDPDNANRGTIRGKKLIKNSLKKYGAGRSILLDANNMVISGNKTVQAAKAQGYKNIKIIDVDGDTLIAVRRMDLDLKRDKKARELAIAENRTAQVDLEWDPEVLKSTDADITDFFDPIEMDNLTNEGRGRNVIEKISNLPPPKMIWVLLGIPFARFDLIQEALASIEAEAEISVQQSRDK